jgi:hypothetical protein
LAGEVSQTSLSNELRRFIRTHIDGLDQLEVLLLLHGDRTRAWSSGAVAAELRLPEAAANLRLGALVARGLVTAEGPTPAYRFAPATAELDRLTTVLAGAFRERRVAVITEIFSKPSESVMTFADAFLLRKK